MTADTLRAAAARLREQAATAVKETRDLPMVKGVWLNGAHYLTTTPPVALAMADWLDHEAACHDIAVEYGKRGINPKGHAAALASAVLAPTDPDVSRVRDHMNKES